MTGCAQARHTEASSIISDALARATRPYVSCSGGKDSMLVVRLVIDQNPDVPVVHSLHGARWLPDRWPGVLVTALRAMGARQVEVTRDNLIWTPSDHDLVFVGLRRSESVRRRRRMDTVERLNPDVEECWPLTGWSERSVWACTRAHGVPVASIYGPSTRRLHWPDPRSPMDRAAWGQVRYEGGERPDAGAPAWLVEDPVFGRMCGECGSMVGDVRDAGAHGPGCWVPQMLEADRTAPVPPGGERL